MIKRLVPFNGKQYMEIDKIALRKRAFTLLECLNFNIEKNDPYEIRTKLKPILDKSLRNGFDKPFSDNSDLIGGLYLHEYNEGILPEYISRDFQKAFIRFAIAALSIPLGSLRTEKVDGVQMAWVDFEEEQ